MMPTVDGELVAPAKRRSPTTHRKILDAACELVARDGYHAITIEGVAARARVGKQTIYRWWPSKAALFVEIYSALVPRAALAADTGCVADDMVALLVRLFDRFRTTPAARILAGVIAAAPSDPAAAAALTQGLVIDRRDLLSEPLQRGIARGELAADFDVELAARVVVALIWRDVLLDPATLTPTKARLIVDCALRCGTCTAPGARHRRA